MANFSGGVLVGKNDILWLFHQFKFAIILYYIIASLCASKIIGNISKISHNFPKQNSWKLAIKNPTKNYKNLQNLSTNQKAIKLPKKFRQPALQIISPFSTQKIQQKKKTEFSSQSKEKENSVVSTFGNFFPFFSSFLLQPSHQQRKQAGRWIFSLVFFFSSLLLFFLLVRSVLNKHVL